MSDPGAQSASHDADVAKDDADGNLDALLSGAYASPRRATSAATSSSSSSLTTRRAALADASVGLAAHVQSLGWEEREFSDVVVSALGKDYPLHRLVLSRSPYFAALMRGPWLDASSPTLTLRFDDVSDLVDVDAVETTLGFLYDKPPTLTTDAAPRVLAAGSFLDLRDLCDICADFIVADVDERTFLRYQNLCEQSAFGMGDPGERVAAACWGFACARGAKELRGTLHHLSPTTLLKLLRSNDLWVANERARFELVADVTSRLLEESCDGDGDGDGGPDPAAVALRAEALSACVNYQHLPFADLLAIRAELELEDGDFKAACLGSMVAALGEAALRGEAGVGAADAVNAVSAAADAAATSPTRAVVDGLWAQTLLKAHVAAAQGRDGSERGAGASDADAPSRARAPPSRVDESLSRIEIEDGGGGARGESDEDDEDDEDDDDDDDARAGVSNRAAGAAGSSASPMKKRADGGAGTSARGTGAGGGGSRGGKNALSSRGGRAAAAAATAAHRGKTLDGTELPFRFGVEMGDVLSLADGQARHSVEEFYAGSLWKVSVQAFSDEDPKGRKTLGLFLHRRPARDPLIPHSPASFNLSAVDSALTHATATTGGGGGGGSRSQPHAQSVAGEPSSSPSSSDVNHARLQVSGYCDARETVSVRYELLCPSKSEIVRLGSLAPSTKATTLPRAPKGWGWRTAMLCDDLSAMSTAEGGLRVGAVIQLADAAAEEDGALEVKLL